ncbi:MAG: site-specific integrase [Rikenellaceae bacterium]
MRSTFKVLFYLKKNTPKKNGFVPVMCRITVDGQVAQFSCKLNVDPKLWDTKAGRMMGRSSASLESNRFLDKIRVGVNGKYQEIAERDNYVTSEKVKNAFLGLEMRYETLLKIYTQHNEDFAKQVGKIKSQRTYNKYCAVYKHLEAFIKQRYRVSDIALKELTPAFITDFELYLRTDKGCSHNTVWIYMMPLRRMITIAQNNGWIVRDPFVNYEIGMESVDRGYVTKDEIQLLIDAKFEKPVFELVRDLYLFCCFSGLSYADMLNLTNDNIRTSFDSKKWIMTKRQKTGVESNVMLLDIPMKIIEKYSDMGCDNKLLPVPSYTVCNDNIKRIAKLCGIDKHLTWHMSRHSFATEICLTNGMPIETLSKMMGHTNIRTTQIYAKITHEKESRDMANLSDRLQGIKQFKCSNF